MVKFYTTIMLLLSYEKMKFENLDDKTVEPV
jgi:hypothetical protein